MCGHRRQCAVDIGTGAPCPPTVRLCQVRQELGLQISMRRLPGEADGSASERNVVARLDPLEILEEEAATGKHRLAVILRIEQLLGRLNLCPPERSTAMRAIVGPERPAAYPVITN